MLWETNQQVSLYNYSLGFVFIGTQPHSNLHYCPVVVLEGYSRPIELHCAQKCVLQLREFCKPQVVGLFGQIPKTVLTSPQYVAFSIFMLRPPSSPHSVLPPHSLHLSWKQRAYTQTDTHTQTHIYWAQRKKIYPKKRKRMNHTWLLTELWIWHRKWDCTATSLPFTSASVCAHHHHHFSFSHGIHFT